MPVDKKEKKSKKKAEPDAAAAPESAAKPAKRSTSNVFALFKESQVQEFKEAFQMMDLNRDGFLDASDLIGIWGQTGRDVDQKTCDEMLADCPGQLNFTHFLNMFAERMTGTDPEATLRDAFTMFDNDKTGFIDEAYFKELLTSAGDEFTKDEIKQTWKEAPIEGGKLDYHKFVTYIKRGKEEEE